MTAQELIVKIRDLKAPSPVVAKLIAAAMKLDTDNEEVVRIMEQDAVLCAKMLAYCNRASVGIREVTSVSNAVFYLGRNAVHRMALSIAFGEALSPALPAYAMESADLWRHALLTAFVTQEVLEQSNLQSYEPSAAYTCGLLHDIGKVVLSRVMDASHRQKLQALLDTGSIEFLEAERQVIGVDHAEVGGALLAKWGLPQLIVEAVQHHHAPKLKPRPQLSSVVHVADLLAHQTGYSPGLVSFAIRVHDATLDALGLTEESWQRLMLSALDAQQRVKEMTS